MQKPEICAAIVDGDIEAIKAVEPLVDLFEVRMDLIGAGWREVVKKLDRPWLACNRSAGEGGKGRGAQRVKELLEAAELGAKIVDLELRSAEVAKIVPEIKKKSECLLSYHEMKGTSSPEELREIVRRQIEAGADICKVVTTAKSLADNWTVLQLIAEFREKTRIVSFAMGESGVLSRILCPLIGGCFTYASIARGKESAPGQITVQELRALYGMVQR